jgi:solute:Na+ symporter, SSS family
MSLSILDFIIIITYFVFVLIIGLLFSKKAGQSIKDYFVSGRSLPWWLAGTSMVATTFAADTPLAITGLVAKHGVAGNWLWWNLVMSGLLTVFLYARLWHRSGVITDVEFTEIRYGGKPAAILRGFRALYLSLAINSIIMGWVTLAMAKIIGISTGMDKWTAVIICLSITLAYSVLSGLWGVVVTDFFQFFIAMAGAIVLAIFAVNHVGGIDGLISGLDKLEGGSAQILSFIPEVGSAWMPVSAVFVYLAINWWAAWYPGAEPGGGGYIAQRIFSAKNEKHGILSTLWFNIAMYALRPWPWIIAALVSLVIYPDLADKESGYVKLIVDLLPSGVKGILLASFAAAFMSTISTQLNWGSSYLVNDFYKRFIQKDASDKHYVLISRISTVLILALGALATMSMETISGAWKFLLAIGAGTGSVYILRWYWWRINAWSEISAMIASFVISVFLQFGLNLSTDDPNNFSLVMIITVLGSTIIWLTVTFLTQPESDEVLVKFYKKVRPAGKLWSKIYTEYQLESSKDSLPVSLRDWIYGVVLVYSFLFGLGKLLFGIYTEAVFLLSISFVFGYLLLRDINKMEFESENN